MQRSGIRPAVYTVRGTDENDFEHELISSIRFPPFLVSFASHFLVV
jgi:hypothetical protein